MLVGVDEAGRGPVVGPLVICGVGAEKMDIKGVKDSKLLTPKRRKILAEQIRKNAHSFYYKVFPPEKIDQYTRRHELNLLEIEGFSEIIAEFDPSSQFFVDSCDVLPDRFKRNIKENVGDIDLVSEHRADSTYPIVSAASILAKVKRDDLIREIEYDLGSGYPSDKKTVSFLRNWYKENNTFPDFVRRSWGTAKRIREEEDQQRLL
ncbi:MAG: ribonuclease HII [Euryarchaeota archaeon]|nr:ribonuclease HII [Euryarchaeota archaeon]